MEARHLFNITETWRNRKEEYMLTMTDDEMKKYLKGRRDVNGYIPGVGGDRCYSIFAVYVNY